MLFLVGTTYIIPKTNNKSLQQVTLLVHEEYKICPKCSSMSLPSNHHHVGVLLMIWIPQEFIFHNKREYANFCMLVTVGATSIMQKYNKKPCKELFWKF